MIPRGMLLALTAMILTTSGCIVDHASRVEKDQAITAALQVYAQKKAQGVDFSSGPCIADEVIDDWSVDIAHNPRQDIDNESENQCQYYRDGKTHHFVELDPEGNLIRAK